MNNKNYRISLTQGKIEVFIHFSINTRALSSLLPALNVILYVLTKRFFATFCHVHLSLSQFLPLYLSEHKKTSSSVYQNHLIAKLLDYISKSIKFNQKNVGLKFEDLLRIWLSCKQSWKNSTRRKTIFLNDHMWENTSYGMVPFYHSLFRYEPFLKWCKDCNFSFTVAWARDQKIIYLTRKWTYWCGAALQFL